MCLLRGQSFQQNSVYINMGTCSTPKFFGCETWDLYNPFLSTWVDMVGVSWDWGREAKTMVMEPCINTISKMLLTHAAQYKMPAKCNWQSVGQSLSACSLLKRTQMAALNPLDFCVTSTWHGLQAATTLAKYYSILQPCDGKGLSIAWNAGIPSDQKQSSEWVSVKLGMNNEHRTQTSHAAFDECMHGLSL